MRYIENNLWKVYTHKMIHIIDYTSDTVEETEVTTIKECIPFKNRQSVTWINIENLEDVDIIDQIGNLFNIHPLIVEDIKLTGQRPKMEEFDTYNYFVLRMFSYQNKKIDTEQVSIIMGESYIITFQEKPGDVFDPIRKRIRAKKYRINTLSSDFLAYSLIDIIIDNYYVILESFGEQVEHLEDILLVNPTKESLHEIHSLKRKVLHLRRSVWPLRELITNFERSESELIETSTHQYIRDIYDHVIQIIDTVETYRDSLSGMLDIYLSSVNNRMNEIMKVLTIISTIFIPLTFITGLYGMNFKYMPELSLKWGYPAVISIMIITVTGLIIYFKRKKWL